jgi:hypothetical protein
MNAVAEHLPPLEPCAVVSTQAVPMLRLSEIIGALSYALDLTEGQPPGHCLRACWIGMRIGQWLGLQSAEGYRVQQ